MAALAVPMKLELYSKNLMNGISKTVAIMKKLMKLFVLVAAAAMALASCQKNEIPAPEKQEVHFTINAGIPQTKTTITDKGDGTYTPSWDGTENLAVLFQLPDANTDDRDAVKFTNKTGEGATATFSAMVSADKASTETLYAIYPYEAFGRGFAGGLARLDLNWDQKPTATSFDPSCDILVARPYDYAVNDGEVVVDPLYFTRVMSVLRVNLKSDFADINNEVVESIKFQTGGVNITGYAKISVENPEFTGEWTTKYDYVTATYDSGVVSINGTDNSVYFVIAPVTIPAKNQLTFIIKTKNYTITKTVDANDHPEMKLSAGNVSVINLNIEEEECTPNSTGTDEPEQPGENEGTSVATLSSEEIKTKIAASKCAYGTSVSYEDMDDGVVWTSTCYTDANARPWLQMKSDEKVYIKISSDSDIKEVEITVTGANNSSGGVSDITKHTSFSGTLSLNTQADGKGTNVSSGSAANNIVTLTPTGNYKTLYLKTSTGARVWNIDVKKSDGGNEGGNETPDPDPEPEQLTMSDITCPAQTENSLTFTWTAVANANGYEVSCNGKTETVSNSTLTYTVTGLAASTEYTISVKAVGDGINYETSEAKTQIGKTIAAQGGGDEPSSSVTVSKTIADIADSNSWADAKQYTTIAFDNVITVTATGGGNTGKYYTNGENWRIYQNETPSLTISATDEYKINTVKITYTINNTGVLTLNGSNVNSGTEVPVNASSISFGVGNTAGGAKGQVRVTEIEVVYHRAN